MSPGRDMVTNFAGGLIREFVQRRTRRLCPTLMSCSVLISVLTDRTDASRPKMATIIRKVRATYRSDGPTGRLITIGARRRFCGGSWTSGGWSDTTVSPAFVNQPCGTTQSIARIAPASKVVGDGDCRDGCDCRDERRVRCVSCVRGNRWHNNNFGHVGSTDRAGVQSWRHRRQLELDAVNGWHTNTDRTR